MAITNTNCVKTDKRDADCIASYQIQYSTSSKFTSKTTSKTIQSSKQRKIFCKNKKSGGKYYYSAWSKAKTVTAKK